MFSDFSLCILSLYSPSPPQLFPTLGVKLSSVTGQKEERFSVFVVVVVEEHILVTVISLL